MADEEDAVRTAFDDGKRPVKPRPHQWQAGDKRPDLEDLRAAWWYASGTQLPRPDEATVTALSAFTVDALMWVAGHPAVRARHGQAAVQEAYRQLVKQSTAAVAEQQEQERAEARRKASAQDAEDADRRRGRSHKASDWRMGRSPASYGGGRMS